METGPQYRIPAVPGDQRHRPQQNEGTVTAVHWYLRAYPQNDHARVLPGCLPQEAQW